MRSHPDLTWKDQYILGIKPTFDGLAITPCIPADGPEYRVRRRWRGTLYDIRVDNPHGIGCGDVQLTAGGRAIQGNVLPPSDASRVAARAVLLPRRGESSEEKTHHSADK
jgi:cellobiose phosphorylase